jgi:Lon protease-like protein
LTFKDKNWPKELPNKIPIFPLTGVIMFPNTYLPLNIFEDRYIKMFNKALASEHKLIGMIQPIFSNKKNNDDISEDNFKIAEVEWDNFDRDYREKEINISHGNLKEVIKRYFHLKKIRVNMDSIDTFNEYNLADQLAMICPLSSEEKQLLLETVSLARRNKLLFSMIESSISELDSSDVIKH